jgi:carboxylesterase type B
MVDCLRGIDGTKIIHELSDDLQDTLRDPITVFNPSIEVVKDENTFIAEHPEDIIRKGDFSKVPWIAGITEQEGLLLSGPLLRDSQFKRVIANFDVDFPNLILKSGPVKPEALQAVKDFYFGKENIDSDDKFQNWTNVMTDSAFGGPTQKAVVLQSVEAPVYAYYYTYKGQFSLTNFILAFPGKLPLMVEYFLFAIPRWVNRNIFGIEPHHYGACHFDEVAMLFPLDGMHNIAPTDKDYQMSKTMVKAWVAFASEPSTQLPSFDGITWPLARTSEGKPKPLQYMHIDAKSSVIDEPNHERNKFWNNLKL